MPTLPGTALGAEVKSSEQKFLLSGILYPNEGETIIRMNRYITKFQAISHIQKKQSGVVGKEGCCGEGGCEASKEMASEQRPAGSEGRRQGG